MTRRKKTYEERRQELIGAVQIIANALDHFENSGLVDPLRVVASQLRALVIRGTGSMAHPLLLDLAEEKGIPLTVYTCDPSYVTKVKSYDPVFYTSGDSFSLEQDSLISTKTTLQAILEENYMLVEGKDLPLKDVIRLVADTEASHYDPRRPTTLDTLDQISVGGLQPAYRAIYHLGRVVRDLGLRFVS